MVVFSEHPCFTGNNLSSEHPLVSLFFFLSKQKYVGSKVHGPNTWKLDFNLLIKLKVCIDECE